MSTAAVNKSVFGRGRGRGWIGVKPKRCNVSKEDIVNVYQKNTNADKDDDINPIVFEKSPLNTQTSVELVSDKIARGILAKQDDEKKPEIATIDLTVDDSEKEDSHIDSNNSSNHVSWIDSIDSMEESDTSISDIPTDEKIAINEIHHDEKCNTEIQIRTESVMRAYQDICESPTTPTECFMNLSTMKKENEQINALVDEKGTSIDIVYVECDLDEKPEDLCDHLSKLNLSDNSDNSILDEISVSNKNIDNIPAADHKDVLLNAVHVDDFIPTTNLYIPEDEKSKVGLVENDYFEGQPLAVHAEEFIPTTDFHIPEDEKSNVGLAENDNFEEQPFENINEDQIVLGVLNDVILTLKENPGDFDNVIDHLTDHLVHFVTQEETLKQVVKTIIGQGIEEPNFGFMAAKLSQHFDQRKALELENGVTFRKVFFKRCQEEFKVVKDLCKDAESCKENKHKISRTCLLFGDLLCTMKLKDTVNPLYKRVIEMFINMFLEVGNEETIVILTKLLKLVGPELDKDRPKDIEVLFDKVKDFYFDVTRSGNLPKDVKENLWRVYKLHSRDWDRPSSPLDSPNSTRDAKFFPQTQYAAPSSIHRLERQKSNENSTSPSSPVDWGEYYDGDDVDVFQNYMDMSGPAEEEFDAYDEFLRMSGQI